MAADPPDRRQHSDRRRSIDRADDLHQRIEQKRQEFDRRRKVRRGTDLLAAADDRAKRPPGGAPDIPSQPLSDEAKAGTPRAGK